MKDLLKKIGATIGTDEAVDAVADEADKVNPGLGRKLLVTLVAASIGAVTTWGLTLDQRVYTLSEHVAIRQTLARAKVEHEELADKFDLKIHHHEEKISEMGQRIDLIFCKVYGTQCVFHGRNINSPGNKK
jgi:hypothetical protein